jgi:hypothetical protein
VGAWVPSCRGFGIAKVLKKRQLHSRQGRHPADVEQVAVADNYIASTSIYHQQVSGGSLMFNKAMSYLPGFLSERIVKRVLEAKAVKPDENAMYLYTNFLEMIWPYDDRGRLIGEDVWEPDSDKAEIIKLDAEDVLTTQQAATLLAPLIKPLPSS